MMFKKIRDKIEEQKFIDVVEKYLIDDFENGTYSVCADLLMIFFCDGAKAKKLQKRIARLFRQTLSAVSVKKWYFIEYVSRGSMYYVPQKISENTRFLIYLGSVRLERKNYPHLTDAEFNAVLCMGTFNYNGYFRENCLKELAKSDGYLRYYAVRANDWVREVRITAVNILKEKLNICSFMDIINDMPMIARLCGGDRRSSEDAKAIKAIVCQRIKAEINELYLLNISVKGLKTRNVFYSWIMENKLCGKEPLKYIIKKEDCGAAKEKLFLHILQEYGCTADELDEYLHDKSANVRYAAVLQKYRETNDVWDGAEAFLCDKAAKIRSFAVFIFKKHTDFDPRGFYLEELKKTGNESALAELGNYGTKEDIPLISGFLDQDKPTAVRKALKAIGKIEGADGAELYWKFLHHRDISVCKMAYKNIAENKIQFKVEDIWEEYNKYSDKQNGVYFLYLLVKSPVWDRMIYLLRLYVGMQVEIPQDYELRDIISKGIYKRRTYARISHEKAEELKAFIEQNREGTRIKNLADELLFDIAHAEK